MMFIFKNNYGVYEAENKHVRSYVHVPHLSSSSQEDQNRNIVIRGFRLIPTSISWGPLKGYIDIIVAPKGPHQHDGGL